MDASSLVTLFGQETGAALSLGESGTVALAFKAGPTLHLEHDPQLDALHCYTVIGQAPADAARACALFRMLLAGNAFGRDTDGATLGLDELTGEIILSRRLELDRADTAWLRAVVESMVSVALAWRERLAEAGQAAAPVSAPPPLSDFGLRA